MPVEPTPVDREGRGAFGGFIGPRTLLGLVENTAPWLFRDPDEVTATGSTTGVNSPRPSEQPPHPLQWRAILRAGADLAPSEKPGPEARTDYFALCLAAHFASAATFVPTDVDTKIRWALWKEAIGTAELAKMRALALGLRDWDMRAVSARIVDVEGAGAVSGHDGERLSVLCGGLVASVESRDDRGAEELEQAIDAELVRESRAFAELERAHGRELDLLRLAAVLTHNAGDVMQGLQSATGNARLAGAFERFGDLAHERFARYGGAFARAAALYRELLASEGHRNYPLRQPRALREDPSLLLPIAPFLDAWGEHLARTPLLDEARRAEVVAALVEGCRKLAGQSGYYRALAGFARVTPRGLEAPELAQHHPASVRRALRDPILRQKLAVSRVSFESSHAKRARAILARFPRPSPPA